MQSVEKNTNHDTKKIQDVLEGVEQLDIPVEHYFSAGTYCRMMIMDAGVLLVGKTHKHDHMAVLLEGSVQVVSKYGTATYDAPYIVNVLAGDKRAFHSLTKVKWMTIHATDETDLVRLESDIVENK
jgi:hypothetical protein